MSVIRLSVGALHPDIGLVEVVDVPPLLPGSDGDGDAVRAHRQRLADSAYAVLRFPETRGTWDPARSVWSLSGPGWQSTVTVRPTPGEPTVVQRHLIRTSGPGRLRISFAGRLDRPEYAMITPVGPVPPRLPPTRVTARGLVLDLASPDQESPVASITVSCHDAGTGTWMAHDGATRLDLLWDGTAPEVGVDIGVTFHDHGASAEAVQQEAGNGSAQQGDQSDPMAGLGTLARISAGARRYTLACTAMSTTGLACCIVTDHRLLPLSWTRDAYYQAALLLACGGEPGHDVVRRHLAWLWGPGHDAHGVWQRSHFVSGAVKDQAFQADQQLYPLLELADYRRVTGEWPPSPGPTQWWSDVVRAVWVGLPREAGGLVAGAENPADDPAGLPYLLSSQLLLGYVARRLAQWEIELELEDLTLDADADQVLSLMREAFTCDGPFGGQWAYDTDGRGRVNLYHDANDVPTAVAPLWGLCAPEDSHWRNTMRFAWSTNNPAYVPGRYAGLGSRHTPRLWPLGDAQEWVVAHLAGDQEAVERVVAKLGLVASADGMLPETYYPATGTWSARHWFAWPGSLIGLLDATLRHTGPWVAG